ncbi:MAG: hypothetical protein F6K39_00010 [Okeania sp. SIO3B3]|nr:hypothetical protein [Okeania sp. SIO3B3]
MPGNYILSLKKPLASMTWKSSTKRTITIKFYISQAAQQILRTVAESFRSSGWSYYCL